MDEAKDGCTEISSLGEWAGMTNAISPEKRDHRCSHRARCTLRIGSVRRFRRAGPHCGSRRLVGRCIFPFCLLVRMFVSTTGEHRGNDPDRCPTSSPLPPPPAASIHEGWQIPCCTPAETRSHVRKGRNSPDTEKQPRDSERSGGQEETEKKNGRRYIATVDGRSKGNSIERSCFAFSEPNAPAPPPPPPGRDRRYETDYVRTYVCVPVWLDVASQSLRDGESGQKEGDPLRCTATSDELYAYSNYDVAAALRVSRAAVAGGGGGYLYKYLDDICGYIFF